MGVRIESGSIVIRIDDMELTDEDNESQAESALTQAVEGAIEGACETYRNALSVESVNLERVTAMEQWAEVRLTAKATVYLKYDPSEGVQPDDWASDHGWNYLVFEASDPDYDYEVVDSDAGEDTPEWDADDEVDDPSVELIRQRQAERAVRERWEARHRAIKDVLDRVVIHGDTFMDGYLDIDLAHDRANVEDHG